MTTQSSARTFLTALCVIAVVSSSLAMTHRTLKNVFCQNPSLPPTSACNVPANFTTQIVAGQDPIDNPCGLGSGVYETTSSSLPCTGGKPSVYPTTNP